MANDSERRDEGSARESGGGSCCGGAGKWIWIVLAVAVVGVLIAKNSGKKETPASAGQPAAVNAVPTGEVAGAKGAPTEPVNQSQAKALPRLVDLGTSKCIPCKMMAPILEDLKKEYAGVFKTEVLDVWQDPELGRKYGIRVKPTQIFFDAEGKELFRHEGYFSKEDILNTWKKHGVDVTTK